MKGPSLQKTAALSTALHVTVVLLALIITRQSNHMSMPSPYIVNLIGPASEPQESSSSDASESAQPDAGTALVDRESEKKSKDSKIDLKRKDDIIAAIKAKKDLEHRLNFKKRFVEIKGIDTKTASTKLASSKGTSHSKGAYATGTYDQKITSEIWQQWSYPETAEKSLEAIINVKIQKDGTISIQDWEKKSGNRLFDNSALKAIAMASPVTPPPYEMKIGIRFTP